MTLKSHWWSDLTTADFAALDLSQVVAVFPVGATEQHGPHLPVRVDAEICDRLIRAAVERMDPDFPALVLPLSAVGKSDEHLAYPGTLTIPGPLLAEYWFEIARSVRRAGCRRILFVNSHGGQPQVMEMVCRRLRIELGMLAVSSTWSRFTPMNDLFSDHELNHGIHGGEVETSVMLHLRPDLVGMDQAGDFVPLSVALEQIGGMLTPEGAVGFGWQAQDLHPSGAAGNAAAADAERGAAVFDRAVGRLLTLIGEVSAFPLETFNTAPDHALPQDRA
ncbi:creatininase family protein [Jiella sp. MQZ9-1]|uniref:Creatininase family protein n=1 Tax=Jiella flava TaxID=2816857 RepID=A0A939G2Z2_9HYPH|nr:creatininase family protein [Jiella flava]MBO0664277.1 creatininase family protein [Jiella flava]MCD2472800.1 creatininase family protein [Jiella flava]